jgi:hypothetical protein
MPMARVTPWPARPVSIHKVPGTRFRAPGSGHQVPGTRFRQSMPASFRVAGCHGSITPPLTCAARHSYEARGVKPCLAYWSQPPGTLIPGAAREACSMKKHQNHPAGLASRQQESGSVPVPAGLLRIPKPANAAGPRGSCCDTAPPFRGPSAFRDAPCVDGLAHEPGYGWPVRTTGAGAAPLARS